jgi:hypothetical protein
MTYLQHSGGVSLWEKDRMHCTPWSIILIYLSLSTIILVSWHTPLRYLDFGYLVHLYYQGTLIFTWIQPGPCDLGDLKTTKQNKLTTFLHNRIKSEWNWHDQKSYSYIRGTLSPLEKGNITFLPWLHGIPNLQLVCTM